MADIVLQASGLRTRARIAAYALQDLFNQPMALQASDVPWHGKAVSPEWLNAVLVDSADGARALRVETLGGDDGSSVRRRIAVEWDSTGRAAGLPQHLFTKTTPTLPTRLSAGLAAEAEGQFLLRLRPHLAIEAPRCYYSARDPQTGRSAHLMDDLTVTKEATFCNAGSRIDRGQAEQIVDTLVQLHGSFHGRTDSDELSWLRTYEDFFRGACKAGIRQAHEMAMVKAESVIPAAVLDRRSEIWPAAIEALAMHEGPDRTVIHSDVHLGNWYVTDEGRMGLCDWARVCKGHWARDLAYALMTTIATDDRRDWEADLLGRYRAGMARDFGIRLSADSVLDAYKRQAPAALLMWTPTLCPPATLPAMQPEATSLLMIQRITAAMDDLATLDLFARGGGR